MRQLADAADALVPIPALITRLPVVGRLVNTVRLLGLSVAIFQGSGAFAMDEAISVGEALASTISSYDAMIPLLDNFMDAACNDKR